MGTSLWNGWAQLGTPYAAGYAHMTAAGLARCTRKGGGVDQAKEQWCGPRIGAVVWITERSGILDHGKPVL